MKKESLSKYCISQEASIVEALQKIDDNAKGVVFALDDRNRLVGSLTDGDIRRWLIKTGNLQSMVRHIMNQTPKTVYEHKKLPDVQSILVRYSIAALPVITADNEIVDIIFRDGDSLKKISRDTTTLSDIAVVIMAGGKGTRLYPYTKILPKPLIPVGEIPIMERIVNQFTDYGVRKFFVTLNYKKNMIKSYFAEVQSNYEMNYVEEEKPLGTGGSLHLLSEKLDRPFIISNCDVLIHADYADLYRYHMESGNQMTVVSSLKNMMIPYGVIHARDNGIIDKIEEKPRYSYFVNTGMYVVNPELISRIPKDCFYHMTDLMQSLIDHNEKVGIYPVSEDSFLDMGEFEEMRRMEKKLDIKID